MDPGKLEAFADFVTLAYHEARNVRHLSRASKIDSAPWRHLISLPTNRDEAWAALQRIRVEARSRQTRDEILNLFVEKFQRSLGHLEEMYANPAWRGSAYGGNAWHQIVALITGMADASKEDLDSWKVRILAARHNTGEVGEKLAKLDKVLQKKGT